MEFVFTAHGDFKSEFKAYVDRLFEVAGTTTRKQRLKLTEQLTEAYIKTTGQVPAGGQLDRLGSLILHEELTLNDPHKASKIGFYSEHQEDRREKKEADFKLAGNYGTDGTKHGRGTRNRSTNELD